MNLSFAGDVYNSAVYLKRSFPKLESSLVTAVGKDSVSHKMLAAFEDEFVDTQFVFNHESKVPGLYLVETDESGERSFIYWRSDAAARKVIDFIDDTVVEQLSKADMFFFSGISLAVIEPEARNQFWTQLAKIHANGVTIVFDPNYRARLWGSEDEAKAQFNNAFHYASLLLPGVEDFTSLYGIKSAEGIIEFCSSHNIDELVIKNGPASVLSLHRGIKAEHKITPVTKVVDTTSAGDAFNGVYIGARLSGQTIEEAIQKAATAAGIVIQHPGAIAPKDAFN